MRKKRKILVCFALLYVLFGCATIPDLRIGEDYNISKYPNKSIIFGRIDVKHYGMLAIPTYNSFDLIEVSSGKKVTSQKFTRDEYFCISLDPGQYRIDEISLGYGATGAMGITLARSPMVYMTFIARPGEVSYIGRLLVEVKYTAGPAPSYDPIMASYKVTIFDEYESAAKEFNKLYPNVKKDIIRNLLR